MTRKIAFGLALGSLLTMLSLGWGVACFVILYSYGEGFETALTTCFKAVGQDLIVMFGGLIEMLR